MKIGAITPARPGGPFDRSVANLSRAYPNAASDLKRGLAAWIGRDAPAPPNASLVPGIGRTILKVRVASKDMQRGKSGGFRVLLVRRDGDDWAPIIAYAKSEREDVSRRELLEALKEEAPPDAGG